MTATPTTRPLEPTPETRPAPVETMTPERITLVVDRGSRWLYEAAAAKLGFLLEDRGPTASQHEDDLRAVFDRPDKPTRIARRTFTPLLPPSQWAPLCMSTEDFGEWLAFNDKLIGVNASHAARPCEDCPASYAAEMRGQQMCNGTPGMVR